MASYGVKTGLAAMRGVAAPIAAVGLVFAAGAVSILPVRPCPEGDEGPKPLPAGTPLIRVGSDAADASPARQTLLQDLGEPTRVVVDPLSQSSASGAVLQGRILVNDVLGESYRICLPGRPTKLRWVEADEQGLFNLGAVTPGVLRLSIYPPETSITPAVRPLTQHRVKLEEGANRLVEISFKIGQVRGRVVWAEDGKPIAGASISLKNYRVSKNRTLAGINHHTAVSGLDGDFVFEHVPVGSSELSVEIEGHAEEYRHPKKVEVPEDCDSGPIAIRMARGARVRGRAEFPADTREVRRLQLRWKRFVQSGPVGNWMRAESIRVDASTGEFQVAGLRPGTYSVSPSAFDYEISPEAFEVEVPEQGLDGVVLKLISVRKLERALVSGRVARPPAGESPIAKIHLSSRLCGFNIPIDCETGIFRGRVFADEFYEVRFTTESRKRYGGEKIHVPAEGLTDMFLKPIEWR